MNDLLNFFKPTWFVRLSQVNRGNVTFQESVMVVRAWTAWGAFSEAKQAALQNGHDWTVYEMNRL